MTIMTKIRREKSMVPTECSYWAKVISSFHRNHWNWQPKYIQRCASKLLQMPTISYSTMLPKLQMIWFATFLVRHPILLLKRLNDFTRVINNHHSNKLLCCCCLLNFMSTLPLNSLPKMWRKKNKINPNKLNKTFAGDFISREKDLLFIFKFLILFVCETHLLAR